MHHINKINDYTDLIVWQKGHMMVLCVYKITKKFPQEEMYCLTSQIRRAVVSVTSNIAEGFGRISKKEKTHFYTIARGSLIETQNQLRIAKDLNYVSYEVFNSTYEKSIEVNKMLNKLINITTI